MTHELTRILGWPRFLMAGALLAAGAFFVLALSQAGHFGWGFTFMGAAMWLAVLAPAILLIDTVLIAVRLIAARRQEQFARTRDFLVGYLCVMWALWGLYFAMAT